MATALDQTIARTANVLHCGGCWGGMPPYGRATSLVVRSRLRTVHREGGE